MAPSGSVTVSATYASSFRAPQLTQLRSVPGYFTSNLPNGSSFTDTLLNVSAGNQELEAEKSKSYAVSLDFSPSRIPGLRLSTTYFSTKFRDRIAGPPWIGSPFLVFSQLDTLSPFVNLNPDLEEVQGIFNGDGFFGDFAFDADGVPLGPSGVQAIFDLRPKNLASTRQTGLEFSSTYSFSVGQSLWTLSLSGEHLLKMEFSPSELTPEADLLNQVGQPVKDRLHVNAGWSLGGLEANANWNYWGGYRNSLMVPPASMASWNTLDVTASYRFEEARTASILQGIHISFGVQNIFDRNPPTLIVPISAGIGVGPGYDSANANPLGRSVYVAISKRWK